jgi:hypothetical protein
VDRGALADEWNELLAIADHCWPYRREHRDPFWQDQLDPPAQRARGNLDPYQLASFVWHEDAGDQVADNGGDQDDGNDDGDGGDGGRRRHPGRGGVIGPILGTGLGIIIGLHHHHGDDDGHDHDHGNGDGKGKGKGKGNGGGSIFSKHEGGSRHR